MAERRMFAKTIVDSDAFLDMPVTARLLYYDLGMRADDDGFVNSPKKIMRLVGASEDDLRILCMRKFIIPFDNGIVVIKHWKIHNYIQSDRYHETNYKEQKAMLELDENKAYRMPERAMDTPCIQNGYNMDTQVRLGKSKSKDRDRLESGKGSIDNTHLPPKGEPDTNLEEMFGYNQYLLEAVKDWLAYKKEKRQQYKPVGLKTLLTTIQNNVNQYGEDAVIKLIHDSMSANYQGITWDRLNQNTSAQGRKTGKQKTFYEIFQEGEVNDKGRSSEDTDYFTI